MNIPIKPQRFPYQVQNQAADEASLLPYLPFTLMRQDRSIEVNGLLDTGATVNVLPYEIGLSLGAIWENQKTVVRLTGNLAKLEARGLILMAQVAEYEPVRLAFAWTQAKHIPIILGQVNFFLEYETCFYRSQSAFEVKPRGIS